MFEINIFSVINSLIASSFFITCCLLLEKLIIKGKISNKIFFFIFSLIILRLLFPLEIINNTHYIQFDYLLPTIVRFFNTLLFNIELKAYSISFTIFDLTILCIFLISMQKCFKLGMTYYKLHKCMEYFLPSQDEKILHIIDILRSQIHFKFKIKVVKCNLIDAPFEFGFFEQTICLPSKNYTEEELYFILSHEIYHFKNMSNWFKLLNNILASILWWHPLTPFMNTSMITIMEINCDEHIIKKFDNRLKAKYLSCLINETKYQQSQKLDVAILFSHINGRTLANRFKFITSKSDRFMILSLFCVLSTLSLFFLSFFFMPLPYCEVPSSEVQVPEFTIDNSYIIKEGSHFIVYYNNEPYIYLETMNESFSNLKILENP